MTVNTESFNEFMLRSTALHQTGLAKSGKLYKRHSNKVLTTVFFSLIERLSITSSIEVGAFRAEFSRRFLHVGESRTALAIEANPYNFDAFKAEVQADNVIYHHAAILDKDGACTLQVSSTPQDVKAGYIRGNNSLRTAEGRSMTRAVEVPGKSLDSLVADYVRSLAIPDPALSSPVLWIDAEGALDLVIKGGRNTIQHSVALFTEVESEALWDDQSDFRQIHQQLQDVGFFPFLRDCEYEPDQFNVIFLNHKLTDDAVLEKLRSEFDAGLQLVPEQ